jgi:hypothetical protein
MSFFVLSLFFWLLCFSVYPNLFKVESHCCSIYLLQLYLLDKPESQYKNTISSRIFLVATTRKLTAIFHLLSISVVKAFQ